MDKQDRTGNPEKIRINEALVDRLFFAEQYQLALQGVLESQTIVGVFYENGKCVVPNYFKARYWYLMAAKNGEANAQFHLGRMYDQGKGVRQDSDTAEEWYEKAARRGNEKAKFYLKLM